MQEKIREKMVKAFEAELKAMVRNLLENLMREERAVYLETHPTSANGYYTRDLLTLFGPWKTSRSPACERGIFRFFPTGNGLRWNSPKRSSPFMPWA